jgi:hypothetical protein
MNNEITYTCRFCKTTRTFEADTVAAENLGMNVAAWIKNLCCDRCAQYHVARVKLCEKISVVCASLTLNRNTRNNSEIESAAREKIKQLTAKFCELVCGYYHFETVNDPGFSEMIIQQPNKAAKLVNIYIRGIINLPR